MTDIPRSVMEEARKIAGDIEWGVINENDALWVKRKAPRIIARALLSRDKRAAEIAEGRDRNVMWTPAEIAAAILTYDTPTGQEDRT